MLKKLIPVLLSILIGFIVGGLILKMVKIDPFEAYAVMWSGIFGKATYVGYAIVKSTPLILTGLSVAFAFRTGLFNIGAEGQFIIGTMVAAWAGFTFHFSPWIQILLILLLAIFASGFNRAFTAGKDGVAISTRCFKNNRGILIENCPEYLSTEKAREVISGIQASCLTAKTYLQKSLLDLFNEIVD